MNKPRIGIVGGGVVGNALLRAYSDDGFAEVGVYDIDPERRTHGLDELLRNTDLIFVCLPTPQQPGFLSCDLSVVEGFFEKVAGLANNFVLRSTVPIGTTRRLAEEYNLPNLVHSPEFLTARTAVQDAKNPRLNVIGWPTGCPGTSEFCDDPKFQVIHGRHPKVPIYPTSSDASEAMKICMNSFFAVKVAFWNEVHAFLTKLGVDYGEVIEAIVAEGRVSELHTAVPGPDGQFGFGGACLPKDLASLIQQMDDARSWSYVAHAAHRRNSADRGRTV